MKVIVFLVFAIAQGTSAAEISPAIVGGSIATLGQIPYQCWMQLMNMPLVGTCGCSIISADWVITAAHCTESFSTISIYAGIVNMVPMDSTRQVRTITNRADIHEHPQFNTPNYNNNDICLLKVPTPWSFNSYVQPIPLPKRSHEPYSFEGERVGFSGWGRTSDNGPTSQVLRYIESTVENWDVCVKDYSNWHASIITKDIICMSSAGGTTAGCLGDSGGPLVAKCTGILLGVYSVNNGCKTPSPHGFTRVMNYLDWIEGITGIVV